MTGGITLVVGFLLLVFFVLILLPMWGGGRGWGAEFWLLFKGGLSLIFMGGGLMFCVFGLLEAWENYKKRDERTSDAPTAPPIASGLGTSQAPSPEASAPPATEEAERTEAAATSAEDERAEAPADSPSEETA